MPTRYSTWCGSFRAARFDVARPQHHQGVRELLLSLGDGMASTIGRRCSSQLGSFAGNSGYFRCLALKAKVNRRNENAALTSPFLHRAKNMIPVAQAMGTRVAKITYTRILILPPEPYKLSINSSDHRQSSVTVNEYYPFLNRGDISGGSSSASFATALIRSPYSGGFISA